MFKLRIFKPVSRFCPDLNLNASQDQGVFCSWYQKPTETGSTLIYRSCDSTQCKLNKIQGTVHRVLSFKFTWEHTSHSSRVNLLLLVEYTSHSS